MMRNDDYLRIIRDYFEPRQAGPGRGAFGISYVWANQPTRFFKSLREMEQVRCAFIREAPRDFDPIRLARETKYYVYGINVPNRV